MDTLNQRNISGQEGIHPASQSKEAAGPAQKTARGAALRRLLLNVAIIGGFALIFFIGLLVMLYPNISNYVNQKNQSRAVASYREVLNTLSDEEYRQLVSEAQAYNARLAQYGSDVAMSLALEGKDEEQTGEYWSLLNLDSTGLMGYIVIDILENQVPLYHGTGDAVLSVGAGHMQGTSLPVGGESTHTVVSAHTGLPSAKFFDGVDTLKTGDTFALHIMNEVFTYQVDQVLTVLPYEVEALAIEPGMDYATLVTCTPYGINSHRLLVRGHRIETPPQPDSPEPGGVQEGESEPGWLARAQSSVVRGLSTVVETAATGLVNFAQWGMDLFGVEY